MRCSATSGCCSSRPGSAWCSICRCWRATGRRFRWRWSPGRCSASPRRGGWRRPYCGGSGEGASGRQGWGGKRIPSPSPALPFCESALAARGLPTPRNRWGSGGIPFPDLAFLPRQAPSMTELSEIWVYLAREPLAALTATLLAWLGALRIQRLFRRHPLANPVLFAVALLAAGLLAARVDYRAYFEGAQFVHFLLGPATVALAVPLHRQWQVVRRSALAAAISVVIGGLFAAGAGVAFALALGAAPEVTASLAPRSVTTPVAMGIAERIGGLPSLTAAVVICSGVVGAALG